MSIGCRIASWAASIDFVDRGQMVHFISLKGRLLIDKRLVMYSHDFRSGTAIPVSVVVAAFLAFQVRSSSMKLGPRKYSRVKSLGELGKVS